ncbi:hypothetical protein [Piscibacillus salipiscarius]|uniref:hypothetical protein n=1 Tax=Piscibacillus salipiscarius TaxID=299480 RepID=UPI0006CF7601|nr:hypothetical protein [Piscibacillus salipiscarius]
MWHKALCTRYIYDNFEDSEKLLDEALMLSNTSKKSYSEREIHILINKANLHTDRKNFNRAFELYEDAKDAIEKLPYLHDEKLVTLINFNLARISYFQEDYKKPFNIPKMALVIVKRDNHLMDMGSSTF